MNRIAGVFEEGARRTVESARRLQLLLLAGALTLLTLMVAQVTGLAPGEFIHTFGDAHLYTNHLDQARKQLAREPRPLPQMRLNPDRTELGKFEYEDFALSGYDPHPHIAAPVAV